MSSDFALGAPCGKSAEPRSLALAIALKPVTDQIRNSLDSKVVLKTIVEAVQSLLDTDRVVVYQFEQGWSGEVVVESVKSPWISILGQPYQDNCFSTEHGQQYLEGRVRAVGDVSDSGLTPCHQALLQSMQVQANLVVPIRMQGQLWGLLIAHECRAPRIWQPFETDFLQQLADQAAIALQQAELYERSCLAAATAQAQARQLQQTTQELTHALQTLQKAQTQLVQTEKMSSLGQLVAGVAHEINNPINFIHGNLAPAATYTQSLLAVVAAYQAQCPQPNADTQAALEAADLDFIQEDFPKILSSMQMGADRIRQIVQSLQNFSHQDQVEKKPIDLHQGLDSTLLILQHKLKANHQRPSIQIVKEYGDLPLVKCSGGQLNQVFMNLLSNAIDAIEETARSASPISSEAHIGQITVRTSLTADKIGRDYAVIQIVDNGAGIPEAVKAHLFDPFFTTKSVGKGTGLGLAISYNILVDKHGGMIQCFSQPGETTEFRIEIPLQQT